MTTITPGQLDGQTDIFDALGEKPVQPPFTVYTGYEGWTRSCGWCGSSSSIGGGATRWPSDEQVSIHYDYCQKCESKHGAPRVYAGGTPLKLVELS